MSTIETGKYELSDDDAKKVKEAAKEASNALMRKSAEDELVKEIASKVKEEYGIKPGDFKKLVGFYHRQNLETVQAQNENLVELYETVFGPQI